MKCPNCDYTTGGTALLKCSHCGKVFERGPLEELQHIGYLQDWLAAHQAQLGSAGSSLQVEIQARRRSLEDQLGLKKVDVEKVSRELVLVEAMSKRLQFWGSAAGLSQSTLRYFLLHFHRRTEELRGLLIGQTPLPVTPSEIEILDFALQIIPRWVQEAAYTEKEAQRLSREIEAERSLCIAGLNRTQAMLQSVLELIPAYQADGTISTEFATGLEGMICSQIDATQALLAGRQAQFQAPSLLETTEYALQSIPSWAASLAFSVEDAQVRAFYDRLVAERQALKRPVAVSQPAAAVILPPPAAVPAQPAPPAAVSAGPVPKTPAAPPKPARPPFDWGKLWEKTVQAAVSGALLRGLLYLGAFMIVVSLAILVVRFWDIFPSILQAAFIFSVPTGFYLAGWIVRARLKLPQAGNALSAVGALLVAVDLAAIYQFGGISVDLALYWLAGSLLCTAIYALTAWRLDGSFFDYITLLGGASVLVALTRLLNLPLEWSIVAVTLSSSLMVFATIRLWSTGDRWQDTARATRYLPQVLIPLSLMTILFVPGAPLAGQAVAFLLASLSYGVLAWRFPGAIFSHAAVWTSVVAAGFTLRAVGLPYPWFGTAAALLAPPYTLAAGWLGRRIPPDNPARRSILLAPNLAGFVLVLAAILSGIVTLFFDYWAGVAALALATLVLAFWSHWFRRPFLVALAAGLFCVPFSLALGRLLSDAAVYQWTDWWMAMLTVLALAYLGIAILLRRADRYAAALYLWAETLPLLAGLGLLINYRLQPGGWDNIPTLAALAGMMLVYLGSALIHDGGKHPGLSRYVSGLFPGAFGQAAFMWLLALLLPLWISIAWLGSTLVPAWLGAALAGLGLAYLFLGQFLMRRKSAYRLPWHATALLLATAGAVAAFGDNPALMVTLYLDVILLAGLAFLYRSYLAVAAASILFIFPFQITLILLSILPHAQSVAYALLACFAYLPLGLWLGKAGRKFALPVYVVGYTISVLALLASLLGRFGAAFTSDLPWVGVLTPAIVTGLYIFSLYRFRRLVFSWASCLTLVIAYGQLLTLLRVPPLYDAAAWAGLAYLYLLVSWGLGRSHIAWLRLFRLPLGASSAALGFAALALTTSATLLAFFSNPTAAQQPPLILAQGMVAGLAILAAVLYRSRWPLYLVPWLAFLPITLFFIGYADLLFGDFLTSVQFGLVWSCLGIVCLLAAAILDPLKERYSHGLYLGGYALALLAVFWTLGTPSVLVWTFGLWVLICAASALSVHLQRHRTWDEIVAVFFGQRSGNLRQAIHDAFLWLAAWLFPVWCVLLLSRLNLVTGFQWLGFALPALAFLGVGVALARLQRLYAWPFVTAGQFYTALALLISAPFTFRSFAETDITTPAEHLTALAFILVQACAVVYYALSAAIYRQRFFAHLAAWLLFFPYTLAWIAYSSLTSAEFALPWMGLATTLLAAGFILDRRPVRYSHGPYLAGYLLAVFSLLWSVPSRIDNLYVLAWCILLAAASHLLVHYRRHMAFDDLLRWLLRRQPVTSIAYRAARALFLFFAVYAFPVWLTLLLSFNQVPLAWRGLALALVAPLYIAAGLGLQRVKEEYTWPMYSAAYALTAIGAMVAFDDLTLATTVLALDAVVYAVSAYIFRQAFWLYLSNLLLPVIALLALSLSGRLAAPWVAGTYMGLAYLYLIVGRWFDRRAGAERHLSTYALPFYIPAYLLSAVSLAVASGESTLAITIYLAGAALYALSAWAFREHLFLYPAAWLAAVPYYLAMSLTSLPAQWYGLGWLPLILAYILLGRFAFHKTPLDLRRTAWLGHPAMPFYLLAYALSISLIVLSATNPLTFILALTAGAAIYLGSAALFRHFAWLYPGLLAAQLALLAYFNLQPGDGPVYYISLPFLIVTWVMALAGYAFSRLKPPARQDATGRLLFRIWKWELDFRGLPSVGYLVTPSWAQPFFVFTLLDVLAWQTVALFGFDTAIIVALGFAILLGLFAMLWQDESLAYAALIFVLLACGAGLMWAQVTLAEMLAWLGGIGFGMYLVGRLVEAIVRLRQPRASRLEVWLKPLQDVPVALTALAVIGTLPYVASQTVATAAALAFAGALYLAIAYRGRYYRLGYLAVGMLEVAWILALAARGVRQPQLYAIPAGLYFTLMGYLEGRRGRRTFAHILEALGLAILMVTSFIQSLNGAQGFPYFVILLVEGVLAIWWGAARRQKIPFFAGLGASVLNVVAQVVVLVSVYEVNRWFIILGVGLSLVVLAVFVERRRERLLSRAQEWRDAVDTWD